MGISLSRSLITASLLTAISSDSTSCLSIAECDFGSDCVDGICQPIGHSQRRLAAETNKEVLKDLKTKRDGQKMGTLKEYAKMAAWRNNTGTEIPTDMDKLIEELGTAAAAQEKTKFEIVHQHQQLPDKMVYSGTCELRYHQSGEKEKMLGTLVLTTSEQLKITTAIVTGDKDAPTIHLLVDDGKTEWVVVLGNEIFYPISEDSNTTSNL